MKAFVSYSLNAEMCGLTRTQANIGLAASGRALHLEGPEPRSRPAPLPWTSPVLPLRAVLPPVTWKDSPCLQEKVWGLRQLLSAPFLCTVDKNIPGCLTYNTLGQNYCLRFRVEDTESLTAFKFAHTWALSAVT